MLERFCIGRAAQLFAGLLLASLPAGAAEISLNIDDIAAPDFSARGIALTLPEDGSADLRIAALHVQQRNLRKVRLHCAHFELSPAGMSCRGGSLDAVPGMAVEFGYRFGNGAWQFAARLRNVSGRALAAFLPQDMPQLTQGALHGVVRASGDASGVSAINADVRLADIGFSDAAGLHAAEKLRGTIRFDAARKGRSLDWRGNIVWQSGDMFWQPLYLSGTGGRSLSASGSYDGTRFRVGQATADLPEAGRVQFSMLWDGGLLDATARGDGLALERLFADYARPFLDKTALSESSLSGRADVEWRYRDGATQALLLSLRDAGITDAGQRFALHGVNTKIDWQADAQRTSGIVFSGGALFGVPFGGAQWQVQTRGMEFGVAQASLPVLDGSLALRNFRLRRENDDWRWQFGASLSQISMEQFSRAVGWPKMLGTLAGRIPKVSYDGGEIRTDGALLFNVFDGTVVASQLRLAEPFGRAPRLYGNLGMRGLDLDLLTRTFSFGNMQGRIDADVNNLELQNWQPARFDARIASSAGNYPKKISQKAVQNISALGGAGAVAAIQRSYLRFFENFGYDRIGWSCVLRNGVCAMGGVEGAEGAESGAYTLVEGGGIPAITVMGYNRAVSWDELLTRLKRVTQGNMQAVVK
jgi:hypothetical protein